MIVQNQVEAKIEQMNQWGLEMSLPRFMLYSRCLRIVIQGILHHSKNRVCGDICHRKMTSAFSFTQSE